MQARATSFKKTQGEEIAGESLHFVSRSTAVAGDGGESEEMERRRLSGIADQAVFIHLGYAEIGRCPLAIVTPLAWEE